MEETDLLFVAAGRKVQALDRYSGRPVWQMRLPRMLGGGVSMLVPSGREVFVGRGGYVYCVDAQTGQVLWERGVESSGLILMATGDSPSGRMQQASAAMQQMRQQQAAAGAAAAAAAGAAAASG